MKSSSLKVRNTIFFAIACCSLTIFSCKKDNPEPEPEPDPSDTTSTDTTGTGSTDTTGTGDTTVTLPTEVLIYHGNGGVGPEGMWGDMTHAETIDMCTDSSLTATHSTSWPSDLSVYRTIILPAPGFNDETDFFDAGQVSDLNTFISDGGHLLIEGENSAVLNHDVINTLLTDLGCATQFTSGSTGGSGTTILTSDLTDDVTEVGVLASGVIVPGTDLQLVTNGSTTTFVTAKQIGDGYVIVTGDGNMFSDLSNWDSSSDDNRILLQNILHML